MKKIEALIKPHHLDRLKLALFAQGVVSGATSTTLRGFVDGIAERITYRGAEQIIDLFPRIKLEIVTHDDLVERIIEAIQRTVAEGGTDDGEIAIAQVLEAVRIRTGEIDEAALG